MGVAKKIIVYSGKLKNGLILASDWSKSGKGGGAKYWNILSSFVLDQ